ncbi:MAG: hypothetical protein ACTTIT_01660 [Treponema sp.]
MKTKRFFYVFLAAVLFAFISCNQNDDDGGEVIDYPFETLYGSWTRTGKIGVMGVAKLKVYKDENDDTITLMDFGSDIVESKTYICDVTKQSPAVYKVVWNTFDKTTKVKESEPSDTATLSIESKNEIYLSSEKMGGKGMPMKKD